MAETVGSIVASAMRLLKAIEAGEEPDGQEGEDGRIALNDLIEEWNNQPLMQPAKQQISQVLTSSKTYTFGTGGDNSVRPIAITQAFIRDPSGKIDYPVDIIDNDEYSLISLKSQQSTLSYKLYYRASYPLGVVNLFPAPTAGYTLFLECQAKLATYANVSDVVDVPPGYKKAMKYNLAVAISPEYKEPSQVVLMEAEKSISWIKRMNSKDKPIMTNPVIRVINPRGYGFITGAPYA